MPRKRTGRPRLYRNAPQMQTKIDQYFYSCHVRGSIPSVQGLCYHLGFADSSSLKYYATGCKARSHFSRTIRMALLRVEAVKAQWLVDGDLGPGRLRGLQFDLRCNGGGRRG